MCQLVKEGERGRKFALVMIDIDLFKEVNDEHGHPVGDRVLDDVAHTLATHIRKTDHVARYGGESSQYESIVPVFPAGALALTTKSNANL